MLFSKSTFLVLALSLVAFCPKANAVASVLSLSCTGTNSACYCAGGSSCTTSGIDTTGASLFVTFCWTLNSGGCTITSSPACPGVGWVGLTVYGTGGIRPNIQIAYCEAPTTSASTTFTTTSGGGNPKIFVMVVAGTRKSGSFDTQNGGGFLNGAPPWAVPSITLATPQEFVFTGIVTQNSPLTIDSGFSVQNLDSSSGWADAYNTAVTGTSAPNWNGPGAGTGGVAIAAFKAALGNCSITLLGTGPC